MELLMILNTNLNYDNICSEANILQAMQIIGYIIKLIKWLVPLIIIILGLVDFSKASLSNDEKAIAKASAALLRRMVSGVVIFLIPSLLLAILDLVDVTNGIESKNDKTFGTCTRCILDPKNECLKQ